MYKKMLEMNFVLSVEEKTLWLLEHKSYLWIWFVG
jgi:hypothetical protein